MQYVAVKNNSPKARRNPLRSWMKPIHYLNRFWQGGVKLNDWKHLSNYVSIAEFKQQNAVLCIPLGDGRRMAKPCVSAGQYVLKGEVIARSNQAPWVHASTSGHIAAIDKIQLADRGLDVDAIVLKADGLDLEKPESNHQVPTSLIELASLCQRMGITGLGGAGFPTSLKLASAGGIDTLLINGAECEPFITCDDRLMRERSDRVIRTAAWLKQLLTLDTVCIGVEPNKPEAIRALRGSIRQQGAAVKVEKLPHRYPAGGQPLLIKSLTGRHLRPNLLPQDIGVMVMNVATLHALGEAAFNGKPLTSRIVTLTGAVERPANLEVPIGTSVAVLINHVGLEKSCNGIQAGGPMIGRQLDSLNSTISKTSGCLIARSEHYTPTPPPASECINCNRCIDTCPMQLKPQNLYKALLAEDHQRLQMDELNA